MEEGEVNYDSNIGKIQIRGAKLNPCYHIEDVDLVDCEISGNVVRCDIVRCNITNSDIQNSNIFGDTELIDCKIKDSYVGKHASLEKCYVFGKIGIFGGHFKSGIFREGKITQTCNIEKEVEVIEYKKI